MTPKRKPQRRRPLVTVGLSPAGKKAVALEAKALGVSEGYLLEKSFEINREAVRAAIKAERVAHEHSSDEFWQTRNKRTNGFQRG